MDILFFSRGRGRGHAIPDVAIMRELESLAPDTTWQFASYATGARTIQSLGENVHDLQLPEDNPYPDTIIRAAQLIAKLKPRVVVAHEEFAAVLAAKIFDTPSVFITDWFGKESAVWMAPLAYAQAVLFLESAGTFDEPSYLKGRVSYVGPFIRQFAYSREDRNRARTELGIEASNFVLSFLPGGWATEARAPVYELLLTAFEKLNFTNKHLFWVAGNDCRTLASKTVHMENVSVLEQVWPIERLMVASDVIVTKNNRGTIMEAAALGIGSVSLSHGLNPVEDYIVPRITSNISLRVKGLSAEYLASCVERQAMSSEIFRISWPLVASARSIALSLLTFTR